MTEHTFTVEHTATSETAVTEAMAAAMTAEMAGFAPRVAPTGTGFRVHLELADAPNGFFTGVEAATTSAVARVGVAAGVVGLTGVDYTDLSVTTAARGSRPGERGHGDRRTRLKARRLGLLAAGEVGQR